jgi:hypothetical protein
MRRTLSILSLVLAIGPAAAQEPAQPQTKPAPLDWNQAEASARSRALEAAAHNKSQGYTLRDGFWRGMLEKNKPVVIAVHLFAKNHYSFSAAHPAPGSRVRISFFDPQGNPAAAEEIDGANSVTAGLSAMRSGRYYLRLDLTEGDKAETCVVYSYK